VSDLSEVQNERIRIAIEDAIGNALEAGWSAEQVRNEVEYVLEVAEDA
jgi:hypothetical protein